MRLTSSCMAIMIGVSSLCAELLAGSVELKASWHEDYRGTPRLDFPDASASKAKSAGEYLLAQSARFKLPADLSNLELVTVRQSLLGSHTRYRQVLNGLPVDGAEIVISQRKADGSIFQVYNNTYPVAAPVPVAKIVIGKDQALQKAWNHLRVHGSLKTNPRADLMYMPVKTGFRLIYKTLLVVDAPLGYWEHKIDAQSGDVISVRRHEISEKYAPDQVPDFSAYNGPVTSLQSELLRLESAAAQPSPKVAASPNKTTVDGTALVFDPDPRTALANDALIDSSPAASFNAAYVSRTLRQITLDAGVYYLQGPWVSITNTASEPPATPVSTTVNGNWTAARGYNAFNDTMCYFHIDQNQRYLQALGYSNTTSIQALPIPVDSDGLNGADNSHYVPSQNLLAFGHGGVPDPEDADVILHEYGHAITFDTTPAFGGGDSGAIGEGFGDYWGASYSWTCVNGSTYHPAWAFSWDGHSADSWSGRFLDRTDLTYDPSHTYVAHETINGIDNYSDQLWGTPLYQAFRDLIGSGRPRTEMDTIVIESFFGIGGGVKMRDMANATVKAAMELYPTGPHAMAFYTRFVNQSILVAFPLPTPTLVYPAGGQLLATGATINVQWNRNGAPPNAAARIEYTSQRTGESSYFYDQVESGVNGWVTSKAGGSDWIIASTGSHSPTRSWFAEDDTVIADQYLTRSNIAVSNGAVLSFWHYYDLEDSYDGGVVEISTNRLSWVDLGGSASLNGYNRTISGYYGSSIGGRSAFSGSSGGFIETRIPLDNFAGQTVSIRFREADDDGYASFGWWVDDIRISVDAPWSPLVTTPTNTSSYAWTLPAVPGTNYAVRLKLTGNNCTDSAWITGAAFTLGGSTVTSCVVTFDPQGGSVAPASATVTNGATYGTLPTPTRTGFIFGGWWTGTGGTGTQVTSATTVTITTAQTLYAKWTASPTYTVNFDAQDGTTPSPTSMVVTYGAPYGTLATTTRGGYTFDGWWTGAGGTGAQVTSATIVTITATQTLYAKWTITRIVELSGNLDFGSVAVGSTGTATLTIGNTGSATLTVSGIAYPAGFIGYWSGTVAAGASQNVTVMFTPLAATSYSGNLTVNCDSTGGTNTKALSGTGTPMPTAWLVISPESRIHTSAAAIGQAIGVSANVSWTALANPAWITVTGGGTGSGNGTVTYSLSANSGGVRSGTITIAGGGLTRVFTVTQAGLEGSYVSLSQRCNFTYASYSYYAFIYDYSSGYQESVTPGFIAYSTYLPFTAQNATVMTTHVAYIYDAGAGRYVEALAFLDQML